jgi:hypothetical protein
MRVLVDYAYLIYGACVVVLIGVDIIGHIGMGAQRWIKLGGMNIQPSEFMKLAMVLALARYFHRLYPEDIQRLPYLIPPLLIMAIPASIDPAPAQSRHGADHAWPWAGRCVCWQVCSCAILSALGYRRYWPRHSPGTTCTITRNAAC